MKTLFNLCFASLLFTCIISFTSCSEDLFVTPADEVTISTDEPQTDYSYYFSNEEISDIIEDDMKRMGHFNSDADYNNPASQEELTQLNFSTKASVVATHLNSPEGNPVGAKLQIRGSSVDQAGNNVNLVMLVCLNFSNGNRWGSVAIKSPNNYFARFDQPRTNTLVLGNMDILLSGTFQTAIKKGIMKEGPLFAEISGTWDEGLYNFEDIFGDIVISDPTAIKLLSADLNFATQEN